MLKTYQREFAKALEQQLGILQEILEEQIVLAPDNIQGDFAFPCFRIAKEFWKNPGELAMETAENMNKKSSQLFEKYIAVGPYVNVILKKDTLAKQVISEISAKKSEYGKGIDTGKEMLVEGWQPNTHKAVHIGHVRNILVSESVSRILAFAGNEVIKCCYPGDIWAHVAKWIRYYINFYSEKGNFPTKNFTKRVWELYTLATRKVDEKPEEYKKQIEELQKKLEDGDRELQKIRKETRELCLNDMKHIFEELWSGEIDKRYFESEVEQPGIQIVKQMLEDGIAQYSEGAVAINLEEYKLGRFLLLKSTGASLYSTKDIALAYKKKEDYPNYDASIYVVWSEQIHHFEQLFKTLELVWFDYSKLKHLAYGLIDLKSWKMSSREGNVILYEDFRDQLLDQANEMMKERNLPEEEKKQTAKKVAFAAMKFAILLQDSEKKMLFDESQALSFEGETGPYIQYTYARINSILRKNSRELQDIDYSLLNTEEDKALLLQMTKLKEEVQKAAQTFKPNYIARFCLDTAQLFNSYYHHHKIIDETNIELSKVRLILIKTVAQVLENALNLLGIEVVESM